MFTVKDLDDSGKSTKKASVAHAVNKHTSEMMLRWKLAIKVNLKTTRILQFLGLNIHLDSVNSEQLNMRQLHLLNIFFF